jgi:hypothetical protein
MGNISKSYGHDVSKHKAQPRTVYVGGERRQMKVPLGVVETWVDPQGNVIDGLQLRKMGDLPDQGIIDRNRALYRRKGWTEHHQCPLTNGAMRSPKVAADMNERPAHLREACVHDPKTKVRGKAGLELHPGCPHIEWLIQHRRDAEAERQRLRRGAPVASAADVQAKILEETKATNAALVEAVKAIAKPKKGATE